MISLYYKKMLPSETLRHCRGSPPTGSPNKRVSGSGFQLSPKSPSATSDTRRTLSEIALDMEMA